MWQSRHGAELPELAEAASTAGQVWACASGVINSSLNSFSGAV
jgi:hypothetical protein